MRGAIIGDIIGSVYEHHNTTDKDFPLFDGYYGRHKSRITDDTVMTCAVALKFLKDAGCKQTDSFSKNENLTFADALQIVGQRYPHAGYGGRFRQWLNMDNPQPYNSWGNGAPMRCSGAGWVATSIEEAYALGAETCECTHNHEESYKAAGLTCELIYRARCGQTKEQLKARAKEIYVVDDVFSFVEKGKFYVDCMNTMPVALNAFFESTSFEDAIRNAVSAGGDSDTIAAITGAIAEAYYGLDEAIWEKAKEYIPKELLEGIIEPFCRLYCEKAEVKDKQKSHGIYPEKDNKMTENLMTTNCCYCKGNIVIVGACLKQVSQRGFKEATKNADQVFSLCLEESHINMAVTKISAILGMHKVTSIKFVSVDRSPHCTQLHYIKHEIERTLPEHVPIEDYVVVDDKVIKISDEAIDMSKTLSYIESTLQSKK